MAGSRIVLDTRDLHENIRDLPQKLDAAVFALTEYYRPRVEAYARQNAPWTDQTSNARNGLTAITEHVKRLAGERDSSGRFMRAGSVHSIVLFHQMPYGIWLEVRWSGRYAIILPTVRTQGPLVMNDVRNLMARL